VALVAPPAHDLDRPRVRLGALDVLVRVGLLDRLDQVDPLELRDPPLVLLVVRQLDPEPLARDRVEQVPVMVQRGVDVEGYARDGWLP
jgi:hypothetical protein